MSTTDDLDLEIPLDPLVFHRDDLVPVDGEYAETFWLPAIGPTMLWLLRNLSRRVERGDLHFGFTEVAHELGVRRSALFRSFDRAHRKRLLSVSIVEDVLAKYDGDRSYVLRHGWFAVKAPTMIPKLSLVQQLELPEHLRTLHDAHRMFMRD
jgi:hypothetical protein